MSTLTNSLAGSWNVSQAILPNGQHAYSGTIRVRQNLKTYTFDWDISAGRYVGIGLPLGNHVFVSCGEQWAGLGIALFRVQQNAQVFVEWSNPELQGNLGSGKFITPFHGSFEAEHEMTLQLPDGSKYGQWNIEIQKTGSLFEITWKKQNVIHLTGLGLPFGPDLAVSWYTDLRQLAFMDYTIDPNVKDTVKAAWALGGFTNLGTETLVRI